MDMDILEWMGKEKAERVAAWLRRTGQGLCWVDGIMITRDDLTEAFEIVF